MEIKEAILRFLEYCELTKQLSPKTIKMYDHYLVFFKNWILQGKKNFLVEEITDETIRRFRLYLSQSYKNPFKGPLKRQTQNYFLVALRSFLRYLIRQKLKVISPEMVELGKKEERDLKILSEDKLKSLFQIIDTKDEQGLRDRAILEVLFSTGLRVSELAKLDKDKLDLDRREFGIVGKGGKARVVFLSTRAVKWLSDYLKARPDRFKPLFIRHRGKVEPTTLDEKMRLTPRSVERLVKKVCYRDRVETGR